MTPRPCRVSLRRPTRWDTRRRNAQHGLKSIHKAIAPKADVIDAMYDEGLGSGDSRWAVGERGMQQVVNAHRIARRIPIILDRGKIVTKGSTRAVVEHRGHRANVGFAQKKSWPGTRIPVGKDPASFGSCV